MPVERWMFIHYRDSAAWVLPVWSAANRASNDGRIDPLPSELTGLGLHIATRESLLAHVVRRMNEYIRELEPLIKTREAHHEFTSRKSGYAFEGIADDLKFRLLLDIDSLLFELNSCWDFMKTVVAGIYVHLDQPLKDGEVVPIIRAVLDATGQDQTWFKTLTRYRNIFTHDAAPYFAVDLTSADATPPSYDLLIMRRNLHAFDDEHQFLRLRQLSDVVTDFFASRAVLQKHLIQLLDEAGVTTT